MGRWRARAGAGLPACRAAHLPHPALLRRLAPQREPLRPPPLLGPLARRRRAPQPQLLLLARRRRLRRRARRLLPRRCAREPRHRLAHADAFKLVRRRHGRRRGLQPGEEHIAGGGGVRVEVSGRRLLGSTVALEPARPFLPGCLAPTRRLLLQESLVRRLALCARRARRAAGGSVMRVGPLMRPSCEAGVLTRTRASLVSLAVLGRSSRLRAGSLDQSGLPRSSSPACRWPGGSAGRPCRSLLRAVAVARSRARWSFSSRARA